MTEAPPIDITDVVHEWWSFGVFVVSLIVGWLLGNARQKWTQEQTQTRVQALELRLAKLEQLSGVDSRALLVVQTDVAYIRAALNEIKQQLGDRA
jgi:hypothetical protein